MLRALKETFASSGFLPHGHCYLWKPGLVWLHVTSDLLIGLSYVAISVTLAYIVKRIRDIPFNWMFLAFGLFIIACGMTHFMEVWTLWTPTYWLAGDLKALTAFASVATALLLPPLVPRAIDLMGDARLAEARRVRLETANHELAALYTKVKALDSLKTQFFANVSHELRTPLALVLGPTEKLLASPALGESERRDVALIARNARTLLRHVNDLLDVAKLEAGKMTTTYVEVDLARLVRRAAAHFDGVAAERGVALVVDAPEPVPGEVDPEKMQRVFLNLLSNAFKFTPNGGTVRCVVAAEGGQAAVRVLDTGPGVQPELREAIFERFRQGEEGAGRHFGGTGLGLSIAKEFVELHRGTIEVGDALGGGAAFAVSLPLRAPAGVEVRRAAPDDADGIVGVARQALEELSIRAEQVVPPAAGRGLVLIVEDHAEMMRFVAETLGDEYRIATAHDGAAGLEQALALRPDLVLSDVMMPGVSGDQLVRAMRERAELDAVPIVLLTAKADDELRVKLLRDGAQDYVMKPFSAEELRARVANLISMKRTRELLQQELASQLRDIELLATEVTFRKRELEGALEAMRVARAQAERASQAKSDFLRLVSHELRTPLTAIQTYLYVLERDAGETLAPNQRDIVHRIAASSDRLLGLIESLLEYAHIETGRLVVQRERVDVPALVQEVVSQMAPQATEKGLELRVAPAVTVPAVQTDPRLIRLIVANLVGNAIKFTMRGAVELSYSHQDHAHRLSVRDSGPGIPADIQTHIFEPFEQLEPVHQKHTPGVGLGLALVREMVQALGGHVELESRVGAGSTFTVVLPNTVVDQRSGQG